MLEEIVTDMITEIKIIIHPDRVVETIEGEVIEETILMIEEMGSKGADNGGKAIGISRLGIEMVEIILEEIETIIPIDKMTIIEEIQ